MGDLLIEDGATPTAITTKRKRAKRPAPVNRDQILRAVWDLAEAFKTANAAERLAALRWLVSVYVPSAEIVEPRTRP